MDARLRPSARLKHKHSHYMCKAGTLEMETTMYLVPR